MFTALQLKERMDEKPFRPFRIKMSSGDTYDVKNHDAAWVLRNAIEIGLDPDAEGFGFTYETLRHPAHREYRGYPNAEGRLKPNFV